MRLFKVRLDMPWVMFPKAFWVIANDREEALDKVRKHMQGYFPDAVVEGYAVLIAHEHELIT